MIVYNQSARGQVYYRYSCPMIVQIDLDARSVPYSDTHTAIVADPVADFIATADALDEQLDDECFACGEPANGHHFQRVYRDGRTGLIVASCDECLPYMRDDDQFREVNA